MIIGSNELRDLIWYPNSVVARYDPLITNPDPEQKKLEGGKYELRLWMLEVAECYGEDSYIGTKTRRLAQYHELEPKDGVYELGHNYYYQATTYEEVHTPSWLVGRLNARNTLNKNGVVLNFAVDDCGHWGRLSVGLYVHPGAPRVKIKHMARFLGIQFFNIGPSTPYEGVYQGGKRYNNGETIEGFVGEEETNRPRSSNGQDI